MQFKPSFFRAAGLTIVLVCCLGCTSTLNPRHRFPTTESLLSRFKAQKESLSAISAEARVDQRGGQGRVRGTVLMFVRRGGQVRFDVMTQFGPAMVLTSDGQRFGLADLREQRFLGGGTCASNIARLLQLPLTAAQVSEVLLGGIPTIHVATQSMSWHPERGKYVIEQRTADGHQLVVEVTLHPDDELVKISRQRLRVLGLQMFAPDGSRLWQVNYEDYSTATAPSGSVFEFPFRVHLVQSWAGSDSIIKFKQVTPNPLIPERVFSQTPSAGMRVEEAHCAD